jgi:hypothetical protein
MSLLFHMFGLTICIVLLGHLSGWDSFLVPIAKRLSIFFLNDKNGDFGEENVFQVPITYLNSHPNITNFYSRFFASQI